MAFHIHVLACNRTHGVPAIVLQCVMFSSVVVCRYVSDHAYDGYKAHCQRKLLQGQRKLETEGRRTYPPSLLEWKSNTRRTNMALEAKFADGEDTLYLLAKIKLRNFCKDLFLHPLETYNNYVTLHFEIPRIGSLHMIQNPHQKHLTKCSLSQHKQ